MNLRRPTFVHAWLLAALLLMAQGLGLAHRVVHAPLNAQAGVAAWPLDHDAGGADCRLVDQLAHADALCGGVPAVAAPLPAADAAVALPPQQWAAGAPAVYLARAPPRG